MLNTINIMGRLTGEPEVKELATGRNYCRFSIACDRDFASGDEKVTDFFDVVAFGKSCDFIAKYFHKGNLIALTGRMEMRKYTDTDGVKRIAYTIMTDHAYFCESRGAKSEAGDAAAAAAAPSKPAEAAPMLDVEGDDLPF